MRVLFISKDFIIEPLGIMYLSAALKKAGHQTDIVKADVENVEQQVAEFAPDIIAYSLCTGQHRYFRDLNLRLKNEFDFFAVFGGPHPTFFNEFINEDGVDAICVGEGEGAMVELADRLEQKRNYEDILNLWVKKEGKIVKNPVRPLADINALAFPDRKLIGKYSKSFNHPVKNFMWSRGCPYNCPYCFNHSLKKIYAGNSGQYVRFRSVDNLLAEIQEVKNDYPLEMVYLQDDIFAINKGQVEEFCQKYKRLIDLPFHCHLRANMVNDDLIKKIKSAGCFGVSFAIEAGNDYLRNQILGRNMTKETIVAAAKTIKQNDLKLRIFNMLGLPSGSLEADFETLKLNIDCRPDLAWACIYQPYPRTALGDHCSQTAIYDGDIDKISETFFEESVLAIADKNKINNLQKLFSLVVSYPVLFPMLKILVAMPANGAYKKAYSFWKRRQSKKIYEPQKSQAI